MDIFFLNVWASRLHIKRVSATSNNFLKTVSKVDIFENTVFSGLHWTHVNVKKKNG